jgi:ketosteroid isomerase-like protein
MSDSFLDAFAKAHRAGQKSFNEGDFETAFAGLASDVEWDMLPTLLETGLVRGRESVIRYFRGVTEALEWSVEAQEFINIGGGRVIVHQRGTATGRTTRITDDALEFFQLWELGDDGLVVQIREFERREDALEAAGLSE